MADTLIKVENVSKKFCRSLKRSLWYGMQDLGNELIGYPHGGEGELRDGEFWAVKDVSFELKRGQCLGLIGRNGAGKTTLLRMLNGLIKPDTGRIEMRGRVGAMIALGAGFNPVLTGRENIYLNASVLGLAKKEIDAKLDEIVEFAELSEFIDSPVQNYSSGMTVRLGFAISSALNPDILLLDEVLAVGDAAFRHKCYHRINKQISHAAVILVSHSMDYIAHISTVVAMMRNGALEIYNDPIDGVAAYNQENFAHEVLYREADRLKVVYPPVRRAEVRVLDVDINYGGSLAVVVEIDADQDILDAVFSFTVVNYKEQPVMCWHSSRNEGALNIYKGAQRMTFRIHPLLLHDGLYTWNFNVSRKGEIEHVVWFVRAGRFNVRSKYRPLGDIPYVADAGCFELVMLEKHGQIFDRKPPS